MTYIIKRLLHFTGRAGAPHTVTDAMSGPYKTEQKCKDLITKRKKKYIKLLEKANIEYDSSTACIFYNGTSPIFGEKNFTVEWVYSKLYKKEHISKEIIYDN